MPVFASGPSARSHHETFRETILRQYFGRVSLLMVCLRYRNSGSAVDDSSPRLRWLGRWPQWIGESRDAGFDVLVQLNGKLMKRLSCPYPWPVKGRLALYSCLPAKL